MNRLFQRVAGAALAGAVFGPICLVVTHAFRPTIAFEMDRDLPAFASGFYPVERSGEHRFVWTSPRAAMRLAGLDRRQRWECAVWVRSARPDPALPQPDLDVAVDGVRVAVVRVANDEREVRIPVPPRPGQPGAVLTLTTSAPFVPGGGDRRELGVQIRRLVCYPAGGGLVLPPGRAVRAAVLGAAAFGALFGLAATTVAGAVGGTVLVAAAQTYPLVTVAGAYGRLPTTQVWLAVWIALLTAIALVGGQRLTGRRMSGAARFVLVFSGASLYLKLLALLHPAKPIVDAIFHAHRFEAVLAGHFFFTQLSTSATPFPYAIGLYLFAAPWALVIRDHVALLRVVVTASEVLAGALLYVAVARVWRDRLVGALGVALFHLVPIAYVVVGHANLTNAFGQSVALVTMLTVVLWVDRPSHVGRLTVLTLLATLGLLSHVGTMVILLSTLLAAALVFFWKGGPDLRGAAQCVLAAAILAVGLATVLYYGHFREVYAEQLGRAFAGITGPSTQQNAPAAGAGGAAVHVAEAGQRPRAAGVDAEASPSAAPGDRPRLGRTFIPLHLRAADAVVQTIANTGWPMILLGAVGIWQVWRRGARDRLALVLAAWALVWLVLVASAVVVPVDRRYQQDAWEFIARVEHTASPAAVVLAACGAAWAWRAGGGLRIAAAVLLLGALGVGVRAWAGWLA